VCSSDLTTNSNPLTALVSAVQYVQIEDGLSSLDFDPAQPITLDTTEQESMPLNSKTQVAKTPNPNPGRVPKLMVVLAGLFVLLSGVSLAHAQGRMAASALLLQVRQEVLLQDRNGTLVVKIRLARGTSARIWAADSCASPSPESSVISASGIYTIPHTAFAPVSSSAASAATQVCLASSDGVLHDSVPMEILGAEGLTAGQMTMPRTAPNGVAVDAPSGWAVTSEAGKATWSKP
jgi:hypothetical protein